MRDWLGKPLLILAVILLVLGAISVYWLASGPSRAVGADRPPGLAHHRQAERIIKQLEGQR